MTRMLRVAHLVPQGLATTRAGERAAGQVSALCRALREAGVEATVVECRDEADAAAALAPALTRGALDAVHAHGGETACHVAALLRDWPLLPVIATLHEGPGTGWRAAWRLRAALRAMDEVTAPTMAIARRHALLAGRAVTVTPPGIELARLAAMPARRPPATGRFDFALVLPGADRKAVAEAAQATGQLVAQGLDVALHVAAPALPDETVARLAADRPWLHFAGQSGEAGAFLAGKHALLLPASLAGRAMPLLAEAMARGLPAVVADSRPLRATAGAAALFARACDSRDLAWQMARLALDELLWHRLARAGRAGAARHGIDAAAGRFAARYRRMLARERGASGLMFAR